MKFFIKFKAPDKRKLIISITNSAGTDIIKDVCEQIGKNIKPSNIHVNTSCKIDESNLLMTVPDNYVYDIHTFAAVDAIVVNVPEGFIGKYWEMIIDQSRESLFKATQYNVYYKLNKTALLDDFIADGCPTNWNISDDTEYTTDLFIIHYQHYNEKNMSCKIYAINMVDALNLFNNSIRENNNNIKITSIKRQVSE